MQTCTRCGTVSDGGQFCGTCGNRLAAPNSGAQPTFSGAPTGGNPVAPSPFEETVLSGSWTATPPPPPRPGPSSAPSGYRYDQPTTGAHPYQSNQFSTGSNQFGTGQFAAQAPGAGQGGGERTGSKSSSKAKWLVIAAVLVVLLGGGIGAWVFFTGDDDEVAAGSTAVQEFLEPPVAGLTIEIRDLLDDTKPEESSLPVILQATSDRLVVMARGVDTSNGYESEYTLSGLSRETGQILWHLEDSDLNVDESGVECLPAGADRIVCITYEVAGDGDRTTVLNTVDPATGVFTTIETEGVPYSQDAVIGTDLILTQYVDDGDYVVSRVDPVTGTVKWEQDVTVEASEFSGPEVVGQFLVVYETFSKSSGALDVTTVLLDPNSGTRLNEIEGVWQGDGSAWYGYADQDDYEGAARVDLAGNVLWENSDVMVLNNQEPSDSLPILAIEDEDTLVGLDPATGEAVWTSDKKIDSAYVESRVGPTVFLSVDERLKLIDLTTGAQKGQTISGSYVGGNESLFYTEDDKALFGYSQSDGSKLWKVNYDDVDSGIDEDYARVVRRDGFLFLIDADKILSLVAGP